MLAVSLAGFGIAIAVAQRGILRDTTLTVPWIWLLASLATLASVEWGALLAEPEAVWVEPLRFTAVTTTFCPLMALLGAKRPQDRGWQLVVFAFWIMLALPAGETLLLRPGQSIEVRGIRAGFLLLLLLLGLTNTGVTRFWLAAALFSAGQAVLLSEFVPLMSIWDGDRIVDRATPAGLGLIVTGLAAAALLPKRSASHRPLDRLWLDFRDMFGLLWGLRLAERVNAVAQEHQWPFRLRWRGFLNLEGQSLDDELTPDAGRVLRQTLENLLRRFVSQTWIAARLGEQVD